MNTDTITVQIGTKVPMGGATGLNLWGTVTKLDGEGKLAAAKVETRWFSRWYPVAQLRIAIAAAQ